jgi:hypothetical protein
MKTICALCGTFVLFMLLMFPQAGFSQTGVAPEKSLSCELLKVDTASQIISVKDPDGQEVTFQYKDDTKIVNPDEKTKGIAEKVGSRLIVTYREEDGIKRATQIQFVE